MKEIDWIEDWEEKETDNLVDITIDELKIGDIAYIYFFWRNDMGPVRKKEVYLECEITAINPKTIFYITIPSDGCYRSIGSIPISGITKIRV